MRFHIQLLLVGASLASATSLEYRVRRSGTKGGVAVGHIVRPVESDFDQAALLGGSRARLQQTKRVRPVPRKQYVEQPSNDDDDDGSYKPSAQDDDGSYKPGPEDASADAEPASVGGVAGKAGVDYPAYREIPETNFDCSQQPYEPGMYADEAARCQVYHVCFDGRKESFLCGVGTVFNQAILACDYWHAVECGRSKEFLSKNEELGKASPEPGNGNDVASAAVAGGVRQQNAKPQEQYVPQVEYARVQQQQKTQQYGQQKQYGQVQQKQQQQQYGQQKQYGQVQQQQPQQQQYGQQKQYSQTQQKQYGQIQQQQQYGQQQLQQKKQYAQPQQQFAQAQAEDEYEQPQAQPQYVQQQQPKQYSQPKQYKQTKQYTQSQKQYSQVQTQSEYAQPAQQYNQPQPAKQYAQPQPTKQYIQPQPTKQYVQPKPAKQYVQPQPAKQYVQPQPAKQYVQPQPAKQYVQPQTQYAQIQEEPEYVQPQPAKQYVKPKAQKQYVQPEVYAQYNQETQYQTKQVVKQANQYAQPQQYQPQSQLVSEPVIKPVAHPQLCSQVDEDGSCVMQVQSGSVSFSGNQKQTKQPAHFVQQQKKQQVNYEETEETENTECTEVDENGQCVSDLSSRGNPPRGRAPRPKQVRKPVRKQPAQKFNQPQVVDECASVDEDGDCIPSLGARKPPARRIKQKNVPKQAHAQHFTAEQIDNYETSANYAEQPEPAQPRGPAPRPKPLSKFRPANAQHGQRAPAQRSKSLGQSQLAPQDNFDETSQQKLQAFA